MGYVNGRMKTDQLLIADLVRFQTPYEGGIFEATLSFPKDYPLSPPVGNQALLA